MFAQLLQVLSTLLVPIGLWCVIDDWYLRPRREIAAAPNPAVDPPLTRAAYLVLPVLVIAAVLRMLGAEGLDFSLVLFLIAVISGVVWALDAWWLRPRRIAAAVGAGKSPDAAREPATVDYARSFFPVALIVLVLRSFLFEPFRIPSDSMMPTLLTGDFIVVNKFAYGLRLPVLNRKVLAIGEPQRGDVVVFRYPPDPSINYIKRLAGMPGDRVRIEADRIVVNGVPVPFEPIGRFDDGCYVNMQLAEETLGTRRHRTMFCNAPIDMSVPVLPTCKRRMARNYVCGDGGFEGQPDHGDVADMEVPPGKYLMIGDNRDNSSDGRVFGFVPEENLVGRASRIWFSWDWGAGGGPAWDRVGKRID
jgi:signal peptidase I